MTDDELLAELRAVFPATPIDATSAWDDHGRLYCDVPEYNSILHGKTWEELDAVRFSRRADALFFLNDEVVAAVLPRAMYLTVTLGPMSDIGEAMWIAVLKNPRPTDKHLARYEWERARFDGMVHNLTDAQRRAVALGIVEFGVRYPAYRNDVNALLDRYWRAFLP